MPFTPIGGGKFRSPSGRTFNKAQVRLYYAHDGFPGEKKERGGVVKPYALGGYVKGGDERIQEDRPRGGPAITERSRFMKTPDVFRTSLEEQDYPKGAKAHARPKGKGKEESEED